MFAAAALAEADQGVLLLEADEHFTEAPTAEQHMVLDGIVAACRETVGVTLVLSGGQEYLDAVLRDHATLAGCFTGYVRFPDYSAAELTELARRYLLARGYDLTEEAGRTLTESFAEAPPGFSAWDAHRFAAYVADTAGSSVIEAADLFPEQSERDDEGRNERPGANPPSTVGSAGVAAPSVGGPADETAPANGSGGQWEPSTAVASSGLPLSDVRVREGFL
jgi:hypothetical protein